MRHSDALIAIDRIRAFHLSGLMCVLFFLMAIAWFAEGQFYVAAHAVLLGLLFATAVHYRLGWIPPLLVFGVLVGPHVLERMYNFLDDRVPLVIMGGILGLIVGAVLDGWQQFLVRSVSDTNPADESRQ